MKRKTVLMAGAGFLGAVCLAIAFMDGTQKHSSVAGASSFKRMKPGAGSGTIIAGEKEAVQNLNQLLQAALTARDPALRRKLLQEWADSLELGRMENVLSEVEGTVDPVWRSEVRRALLSSWTERDLPGMGAWFGKRNAADEMHQESRDILIGALAGMNPSEGLDWMQKSLSISVRQELYGPFFRQWAARDPAAAAAKSAQLAGAFPADKAFWNDLTGQAAAQWASLDLTGALAWAKALPGGPAKSKALVQLAYTWAGRDPAAAVNYAKEQKDPMLIQVVLAKWTETDPRGAAAWSDRLPAGEGRNAALVSVATAWAQKDPGAAAAYISNLSTPEAKSQAQIAIASVWSSTDPAATAKWVEHFPEGTVRELALGEVMGAWTGSSPAAASEWLLKLPEARSRDVAVVAFCSVLDTTDPELSFGWAESISDETLRNQRLERTAGSWLEKDPVAARRSIMQSSLPGSIKKQLLARAYQGGV